MRTRAKILNSKKVKLLKEYFQREESVVLAFLFGSFAKGNEREGSDLDLALYLTSRKKEDEILFEIVEIVEKEVDLIILNETPATLISNIFKTGILLVNKDEKLYWDIYLKNSSEAEDFLEFAQDFWRIKREAKSLSKEERVRLILRIDYLEDELKEIDRFKNLSWEEYFEDKDKRRNIERWTENIINALIDISKIVLASEKKRIPQTYEQALFNFGILTGLNKKEARKLSKLAVLRNILAHEYLDILYKRIKSFIKDFSPLSDKISLFLDRYLKR